MLDVDRGDHVDPGVEKLLDILPSFLVARTRDVSVRELIHQGDLRPAGEDRVQIHLFEGDPAVRQLGAGDDFEAVEQRAGQPASVRLSERDHHIGSAFGPAMSFAEHGVGLADAGRGSEVNPQVPTSRPSRRAAGRRRPLRAPWAVVVRPAGLYPAVAVSHFPARSFSATKPASSLSR